MRLWTLRKAMDGVTPPALTGRRPGRRAPFHRWPLAGGTPPGQVRARFLPGLRRATPSARSGHNSRRSLTSLPALAERQPGLAASRVVRTWPAMVPAVPRDGPARAIASRPSLRPARLLFVMRGTSVVRVATRVEHEDSGRAPGFALPAGPAPPGGRRRDRRRRRSTSPGQERRRDEARPDNVVDTPGVDHPADTEAPRAVRGRRERFRRRPTASGRRTSRGRVEYAYEHRTADDEIAVPRLPGDVFNQTSHTLSARVGRSAQPGSRRVRGRRAPPGRRGVHDASKRGNLRGLERVTPTPPSARIPSRTRSTPPPICCPSDSALPSASRRSFNWVTSARSAWATVGSTIPTTSFARASCAVTRRARSHGEDEPLAGDGVRDAGRVVVLAGPGGRSRRPSGTTRASRSKTPSCRSRRRPGRPRLRRSPVANRSARSTGRSSPT